MNVYNSRGETSCKEVICLTEEDMGEQYYDTGKGNMKTGGGPRDPRTCSMANFGISDEGPTVYATSQSFTWYVVRDYRSQK
jgi:hypothetical protein